MRQRGSDDWSDYNYGYDGFPIEGVTVEFVCEKIPVVTLDKSSPFDEYASWMLQGALGITGKAASTYDHFYDDEITEECFKLGYRDQDICMVRCREGEFRNLAAVGVSGKRSVMLAVVIAACLEDPENDMDELWTGLISYRLNRKFDAILRNCHATQRERHRETRRRVQIEESDGEELEGVSIKVVHGNVPVVSMDKGSIFDECASWMLQIAADSMTKATGLYDYAYDDDIMQELFARGYNEQDVVLAKMKPREFPNVYAVGATGKRSVMLGLCVALIIQNKISPANFAHEARQYQERLEQPCRELAELAIRTAENARGGRRSNKRPPPRVETSSRHGPPSRRRRTESRSRRR
mmetsp:Transcript_50467/g.80095  ORF Transcript_50467/g.80095 Transcript_50467/m.80095 type:complete len:353 (+) Transcript_50467:77-1135(+)